jgi:NADH:ubiquinone oxidoreductase subunit D
MAKKSAKTDKAPKPVSPEPDDEQERLTDSEHSEELGRMVDRLRGLQVAIEGLLEGGLPADFIRNGVYQLFDDVCDKMQACTDAFRAARQDSMAQERREEAVRVLGSEEAVKMMEERRAGLNMTEEGRQ